MPILTKPSSITKGSPAEMSINKSSLVSHPLVSADSYFNIQSNWKSIELQYTNPEGQSKTIVFDASQGTPISDFLVSAQARDVFEIHAIKIIDFDNGTFVIPRSQLTTSEFDIVLLGLGLSTFSRDFSSPQGQTINEPVLTPVPYGSNYVQLDFTQNNASLPPNYGLGISYRYLHNNISVPIVVGKTYHVRIHVLACTLADTTMDVAIDDDPYTPTSISAAALTSAVGSYIDVECSIDSQITFVQLIMTSPESGSGYIRISKIEIIEKDA